MATTKAKKARNRKILWYVILIIITIVQGFLIADEEEINA